MLNGPRSDGSLCEIARCSLGSQHPTFSWAEVLLLHANRHADTNLVDVACLVPWSAE
jgi:hypothetical protein